MATAPPGNQAKENEMTTGKLANVYSGTFQVRHAGFTVIELCVTLTIVGVVFGLGLPNALIWLKNAQIRTAAETLSSGLQLARAEALRRNVSVEFVLTDDSIDSASSNNVVATLAGRNWLIRLYREDGANTAADFIQARSGAEASSNTRVLSNAQRIVFNSLGDYSVTEPANVIPAIALFPKDGACETDGGNVRCLEVNVKPGGMIKMCDPRVDPADPRTCTASAL
ncbi:MAG: GspH/FimT family pseudopilin [Betaproteobacteria bacterium]